jgi:hypothetical protein
MTEEEKQKSKLNITATSWYRTPVGYYCIDASRIAFYYKPNFIHRLLMRVLLGFTWIDA